MSKTRVYELAKELGLENKAVIQLCEELGIPGKKSHSSTMSDDEADRVRRSVIRQAVGEREGTRQVTREGTVLEEKRVGNVIRRRKKSDEEMAPEPTSDRSFRLEDAPMAEFQSLAPDLGAERAQRSEALARANALFRSEPAVSEDEAAEDDGRHHGDARLRLHYRAEGGRAGSVVDL